MTWPDWPKDNAKVLSQYVLPDIAERIKLDIRRDDALARNDRVAIVRAVYDALAKFDLRYARELYHPNDKVQRIRDPEASVPQSLHTRADGGDRVSLCLRCMSPEVMLWTAPPPARECHGCGRC